MRLPVPVDCGKSSEKRVYRAKGSTVRRPPDVLQQPHPLVEIRRVFRYCQEEEWRGLLLVADLTAAR